MQIDLSAYDVALLTPDLEFDLPSYARMLGQQHLVCGTCMRVLDDPDVWMIGIITDVSNDTTMLWFSEDELFCSFVLDSLVLQFEWDDCVNIICEEHMDRCGLVTLKLGGGFSNPGNTVIVVSDS